MRRAFLVVIAFLVPTLARAEDRVMLSPGPGYRIRFVATGDRVFDAYPRVERQGWSPVDRWFQVAPGGGAAAIWSAPTGLVVLSSNGTELWRRKGDVTAFRFSQRGERLAFATAHDIQVFDLAQRESRRLATLAGADWLAWTNVGLVVRTRSRLEVVSEDGKHRILAKVGSRTVVAAGGSRLVYFTAPVLREIDLAQANSPTNAVRLNDRDPVLVADSDADGARFLFATAKRVYLREGATVKLMAEIPGVHSLSVSPDGTAQLWVAAAGGAVTTNGKTASFPETTLSARFRADGAAGVVLTTEGGVLLWNPSEGAPKLVGGISPDDGVNITGDLVDGAAISFVYVKTGRQKEMQVPTIPFP